MESLSTVRETPSGSISWIDGMIAFTFAATLEALLSDSFETDMEITSLPSMKLLEVLSSER